MFKSFSWAEQLDEFIYHLSFNLPSHLSYNNNLFVFQRCRKLIYCVFKLFMLLFLFVHINILKLIF